MVGQVSPIAIGINKSWSMTCGVEKTNLGMVWPCEHSLGKWFGIMGSRGHWSGSKYNKWYESKPLRGISTLSSPEIIVRNITLFLHLVFFVMYRDHILDYFPYFKYIWWALDLN
jgi:hypothetical protein